MKNIYLIGMRGVGKSTVAKLLAKKMARDYLDMDKEIRARSKKSVQEIVSEGGWEKFRQLERELLQEISAKSNLIVSTGGGVPIYFDNADLLKKTGLIILITMSPENIVMRIKNSKDRPSLTSKNFLDEIEEVWQARKDAYYDCADQIFSADGLDSASLVELIIKSLDDKPVF